MSIFKCCIIGNKLNAIKSVVTYKLFDYWSLYAFIIYIYNDSSYLCRRRLFRILVNNIVQFIKTRRS